MTEPTITPELPAPRGLLPHPERACEPLPGSHDGKWIFESIFAALKNKTVAATA
jgi:phosphoribosylformylglycinamidine (FGAM) synthase-like amidotransferase family enzyme